MRNITIAVIHEPSSFCAHDTGEQKLIRHLIRSGITECIRCAKEYYSISNETYKHLMLEEIQYNKDFLTTVIDYDMCVFAGFSSASKIMGYINMLNQKSLEQLSSMTSSCL